jgi:cell division protein FtsL
MQKNSIIKIYYATLVTLTLVFAAYTIHVGGMNVMFGQHMAELESEASTLSDQKTVLQQQIATETSFAKIADQAVAAGYQPQAKIISLSTVQSVALR